MVQFIKTYTNVWLTWYEITIEADMNRSLPTIDIIGLPDAAIKEAKERIRWTFRNTELKLPPNKVVLNLSPSDIRKVWTRFDLPMAVAILLLTQTWNIANTSKLSDFLFFGELWLDGSVKRIDGLLPSVIHAINHWYKHFFVPSDNLYELEYIEWINIYPLETFQDIVDFFILWKDIPIVFNSKKVTDLKEEQLNFQVDFGDIKWHLFAKRALSIAAAWLHNLLLVWAPGSWKTMLSKALPSILPPLRFDEILEVSQIYSVVGKLSKDQPLIIQRPFRQVHHTASKISIIWWWRNLTPWEVSLAHKGILFFDEMPEFPREVLEVLRQPIEDKTIAISRVSGTVQYPANFMFVWTMNPCKCWFYKDPEKSCHCSFNDIKRYQSTLSGPLLDRIDIILEIPRENIDTILEKKKWENSESLRNKVMKAREMQQKRYKWTKVVTNAHLDSKWISKYIKLWEKEEKFLKNAVEKLWLSPRVLHRLMKLARTIADMEGAKNVEISHLAESLQYRQKTMFIENEL